MGEVLLFLHVLRAFVRTKRYSNASFQVCIAVARVELLCLSSLLFS